MTPPLTRAVRFNKAGRYPFLDQHYAIGIDAGGTIRRSEFGMTYGDGWVGEEIHLVIGWRRSARSSGEAPLRRRRS
jgi:polyisoprenoid-binding protein YceI